MKKLKDVDYQNSPVVWFSMMNIEANRGNFALAAEAKRKLEQLGVFVRFKGVIQRKLKKAEQDFRKKAVPLKQDLLEC